MHLDTAGLLINSILNYQDRMKEIGEEIKKRVISLSGDEKYDTALCSLEKKWSVSGDGITFLTEEGPNLSLEFYIDKRTDCGEYVVFHGNFDDDNDDFGILVLSASFEYNPFGELVTEAAK